jgi:hypothetical protein
MDHSLITWTELPEAESYRITFLDPGSGRKRSPVYTEEAHLDLSNLATKVSPDAEYRVEAVYADKSVKTIIPFQPVDQTEAITGLYLHFPIDIGAMSYRLLVKAGNLEYTPLVRRTPVFPCDLIWLTTSDLLVRMQIWKSFNWEELYRTRDLFAELLDSTDSEGKRPLSMKSSSSVIFDSPSKLQSSDVGKSSTKIKYSDYTDCPISVSGISLKLKRKAESAITLVRERFQSKHQDRNQGPKSQKNIDTEPDMFMLSIDTEASLARMKNPDFSRAAELHVFGKQGSKYYGIPLIMSMLEERKMKGVFFLDFLMSHQFGEDVLRRTVESIVERGHDLQLHLHPNPNLYFASDKFLVEAAYEYAYTLSADSFRIALDESIRLYEKILGECPIAFRNGSYHLRNEFLDILVERGIIYDSTLFPFKNYRMRQWGRCRTLPYKVRQNLIEFPISWLSMPNDISQNYLSTISQFTTKSGSTLKAQTECLQGKDRNHRPPMFFMALMHSYTLLKEERIKSEEDVFLYNDKLLPLVNSKQYGRMKRDKNASLVFIGNKGHDNIRIKGLGSMLDAVESSSNIETVTFRDLKQRNYSPSSHIYPVEPYPEYLRDSRMLKYGWTRKYTASYIEELERDTNGG